MIIVQYLCCSFIHALFCDSQQRMNGTLPVVNVFLEIALAPLVVIVTDIFGRFCDHVVSKSRSAAKKTK